MVILFLFSDISLGVLWIYALTPIVIIRRRLSNRREIKNTVYVTLTCHSNLFLIETIITDLEPVALIEFGTIPTNSTILIYFLCIDWLSIGAVNEPSRTIKTRKMVSTGKKLQSVTITGNSIYLTFPFQSNFVGYYSSAG